MIDNQLTVSGIVKEMVWSGCPDTRASDSKIFRLVFYIM